MSPHVDVVGEWESSVTHTVSPLVSVAIFCVTMSTKVKMFTVYFDIILSFNIILSTHVGP